MIFFLLEFIVDIILVGCVYALAYIIKFKMHFSWDITQISYGNYVEHARIETYLQLYYIILLVWIFSLLLFAVYKERKGVLSGIDEFLNIIKAGFLSMALIITSTFLFHNDEYSRYVFLYGAILSIIFISINHQFNFKLRSFFKRARGNCKRAVTLGTDELAQNAYARIINEKHTYQLLGAFGVKPEKLIYSVQSQFVFLGERKYLIDYVVNQKVDTVFVFTSDLGLNEISETVEKLLSLGVAVKFQPSFLNMALGKLESSDDLGMAFFNIRPNNLSEFQFLIKRTFDVILAILSLVFLVPLFLIVAFFIKISDGGSVFFIQERVGYKGKNFMMYKFRTMPENIEKETGPVINTEGLADRATLVGKILRKTSLDELPQFINILKGDMSFVGPRPERPIFVKEFIEKFSDYNLRHNVLPGITGWAQINGRSALSTRVDEKLMYDLYYINNWSLVFDFKIFIKTLVYVLTWQGAY